MKKTNQKLSLIRILLCSFFCQTLFTPVLEAQTQTQTKTVSQAIRGTRVHLTKPAGFEPAATFSGFQEPDLQASIMVTEMPGPYPVIAKSFTEAQLSPRGMKLLSKQERNVSPYEGILVEILQEAQGLEFHKWILVFGDESFTTIVTAAFPEENANLLSEKMKEAVLSTKFDNKLPLPSKQDDLPFTVSAGAGLKLAARVQNMLLFNESGTLPKQKLDYTPVVFIAGQSIGEAQVNDRASFAKQRLRNTKDMSNFVIESESDLQIAGMPGREILATAEENSGEKVFVYMTILFGKNSYFIMQGSCPAKVKDQQTLVFKSMARSFKLKS